jgi:cytochrome c-type biogenesis protein CcmH/NrfG
VHYKLGRAYHQTGDVVNAYIEYARAGDLDPANVDAHMRAGTILLLARGVPGRGDESWLALDADPRHVPAHVLLANAKVGLNARGQAMDQIQEALKLDPSYAPAWTALGAVTFMSGRTAEAAAAYKKAVELAPRSIESRLALANYERATGAVAAAERTLTSALEIESRERRSSPRARLVVHPTGEAKRRNRTSVPSPPTAQDVLLWRITTEVSVATRMPSKCSRNWRNRRRSRMLVRLVLGWR